jgi:hypothetical protein
MKIRIVSIKSEIPELNPTERIVHLAFRPSNVDLIELIRKCPRLRAIQMPHSYVKTLSDSIQAVLGMHGIDLLEGDVWGHRKDLDEYVVIEDETLNEIRTLFKQGAVFDDIKAKVKTTARLNPDLIRFIVKTG